MVEEVRVKKAIVGMRRSMKAIEQGLAQKAFIAGDVDPYMTRKILDACKEHGVAVELVASKAELGKACRIDVDASIAVLTK